MALPLISRARKCVPCPKFESDIFTFPKDAGAMLYPRNIVLEGLSSPTAIFNYMGSGAGGGALIFTPPPCAKCVRVTSYYNYETGEEEPEDRELLAVIFPTETFRFGPTTRCPGGVLIQPDPMLSANEKTYALVVDLVIPENAQLQIFGVTLEYIM
jgi:hypothetical protein